MNVPRSVVAICDRSLNAASKIAESGMRKIKICETENLRIPRLFFFNEGLKASLLARKDCEKVQARAAAQRAHDVNKATRSRRRNEEREREEKGRKKMGWVL